jgi:hypothetical protein
MKTKEQKITVQNLEISIVNNTENTFISLTDIAKFKHANEPNDIIKNWLRTKSTIAFLGLWEILNNPVFKPVEFDGFKNEAGYNHFVISPQKWIEKTNAIGISSKSGRYGGTFAHTDIAFEFASWISPEFKLYLIKEFQRLKKEENSTKQLDWSLQRTIAKINYRIHTDAIQQTLVPATLSQQQKNYIYSDEADLLNVAIFGQTAKQWRDENSTIKGNIRDIATLEQLIVLSNLESINAILIQQRIAQPERLQKLNEIAVLQMRSLLNNPAINKLHK